jgi:hypothetical protein
MVKLSTKHELFTQVIPEGLWHNTHPLNLILDKVIICWTI